MQAQYRSIVVSKDDKRRSDIITRNEIHDRDDFRIASRSNSQSSHKSAYQTKRGREITNMFLSRSIITWESNGRVNRDTLHFTRYVHNVDKEKNVSANSMNFHFREITCKIVGSLHRALSVTCQFRFTKTSSLKSWRIYSGQVAE